MNNNTKKIVLSILTLIGCFGLHAEEKQSAKFSVFQFNVWNEARGFNNGFEAIVDVILQSDADFITLSEVRNYDSNFTQRLCEAIKAKGGKSYYSFRSDDSGLLSSHPIAKHQTVFALSNDRGSVYKAITQIAGRRVALYTAHLDYTHYPCYYPRGYNGENWQKLDAPVTDTCEIRKMNLASHRDEQIEAFIADAQKEKQLGTLIFLGGDFNEPSHLDWGNDMKDLFDHNGVVYEWDQSKSLYDNGFTDSYREVWPDATAYPGITYPSDNPDQAVSSLTWAPEADERDRIDFIYHGPHKDLKATNAQLVGPKGTICCSQRADNPGKDIIMTPKGIWPSDHKAVLIEYTLNNADINAPEIDPLTPEEKAEIEEELKNKVVETSNAKEKICYRIKNVATGLYAARDEWKKNVRLVSKEEASQDAQAYWWFEDGAEKDTRYVVRNYASLDNLNLYALDNNFRKNDGTEWYIVKTDSLGHCKIGWGSNDDYDWTASSNGIINKKSAKDTSPCLWVFEKAENRELPTPYIMASSAEVKHYYTLLNRQKDQFVATAPADPQEAVVLDTYQNNRLHQLWLFEAIENQPQDFYIRNAAYPHLYWTGTGTSSFGTEKVAWNLQLSETDNQAIENTEKPEIKKYFVLRKKGESQCLSYSSHQQGAELVFWEGNNSNWCDTWAVTLVPVTTGIDSVHEEHHDACIFNMAGQKTTTCKDKGVYIIDGKKIFKK